MVVFKDCVVKGLGATKTFIYYSLLIYTVKLIQLKGVSKEFGKHSILKSVNLTIDYGDILGVIGQSGSGKSTLLNLISGFVEPTDGEVVYVSKVTHKEKNLRKNLHLIKKHIGFTPQHNSFYPKLTVKENLVHFGRLYEVDETTLKENIKNILKFTHLSESKNTLAENLSGGMQKRLDISCSLIHKPRVLILDEPTADLDPILQKEILQLLLEVNRQGVTIVIASHQLNRIESICDKVAIVHEKTVHMHGKIDDIRKPFLKKNFTIHIRPDKNKDLLITKLKELKFKKIIDKGNHLVIHPEDVHKTINDLLIAVKEEQLHLHDIYLQKPSLSEIFEKVAKGK